LRSRLGRLRLALLVLLLARVERLLRVARSKWLALANILLVVAVVVTLFGRVDAGVAAGLLLIIRLALTELLLSRYDQTKIMLCVLIIIFRCNWITGTLCIPSKLKILFGDMRRRTTNFYVRSVGLKNPGQWILMVVVAAAFTITTPHALVLTVSHGSLFANPLVCNGNSAVISLNYRPVEPSASLQQSLTIRRAGSRVGGV
jgi:hypothetical protein